MPNELQRIFDKEMSKGNLLTWQLSKEFTIN